MGQVATPQGTAYSLGLTVVSSAAVNRINARQGWFEVIVGKSLLKDEPSKRFAFVQTYDEKPKRRLFETLRSHGMQMNQDITFLSDGGDDVRELQYYLNPQAEHILDWFHVTMKITAMRQIAKGIEDAVLCGENAGVTGSGQMAAVAWSCGQCPLDAGLDE